MSAQLKTSLEERLEGIGICPGIAIGTAFLVDDPRGRIIRVRLRESDVEREIARFRKAVEVAQQQLNAVYQRLREALGEEQAYILEAHVLLLQDQTIGRQVEQFIRDNRANAEWAVRVVSNRLLEVYAEITDEYMRARSTDLEDVSNRIITILSGTQPRTFDNFSEDAILVADDLLPSIAAEMNTEKIHGFATNVGGWTSHTAIIARSLNIPAVAGLRNITSHIRSGETIIIDGNDGLVIVRPAPDTMRFYLEQRAREQQQAVYDLNERELPAITRDGQTIALRANIELTDEIDAVQRFNAAGIGLFRSEFLYAKTESGLPSEDEQYEVYKLLAETSGKEGAVIRTFDLGGDKLHLSGFKAERNPALGLRAIRLSFRVEEVFRTQLRAILRAAVHGHLKIVLPMISNLDELRRAKQTIAAVAEELRNKNIPHQSDLEIGVMIEVPSAVFLADHFAREAAFFSLGTNDLTQYLLAVDRANENVTDLFDSLHPGVLRAIKLLTDAAHKAHIPVTVCGEMAANPAQALVLLGLGLFDLSMTPSAIPLIKRVIRAVDLSDVRKLAEHTLTLVTPAEVSRYVHEEAAKLLTHQIPATTQGN
ncbi:MAG TPA: phosphoenolpyruvate--protein phosphotransferase [Blastocatellia bacterium]|nr:phosphoenolpyruvate--protein phosphotransferase [Blastocatellia bacterium]